MGFIIAAFTQGVALGWDNAGLWPWARRVLQGTGAVVLAYAQALTFVGTPNSRGCNDAAFAQFSGCCDAVLHGSAGGALAYGVHAFFGVPVDRSDLTTVGVGNAIFLVLALGVIALGARRVRRTLESGKL